MTTRPAPTGRPHALLRPDVATRVLDIRRLPPPADLAGLVDYFWYVGWDLESPHRQQVVPQPCVDLAVEAGGLWVHGVRRRPFVRVQSGRGHTLGTRFRAGGVRPFLSGPVSVLTDRMRPVPEVFGVDDAAVVRAVLDAHDPQVMVEATADFLRRLAPAPDPRVAEVAELMGAAEHDPGLHRAADLAGRAGLGLRSLERLFGEYVGVGPKWVIQRFRILDAAAAAHAGSDVDWADLARRLGFADQAHLVRAFSRVVGTPPAGYRLEVTGRRG
ncbi:helix-turn-helix domain-containing protein [Nakamurella sp. YIM 132087]|uniref:Helix-turn-helix domain-containing protein n=1 Tax=Nakamurella alba TaxID=2665158 RepID=A0A7K1FNZ6_9ACTN|nr:helix-turn-helix domain-containing protein [Nakamurella alba]MTD15878.1 helix-turn-helix domain-containing protein [Nakamurella alba]